MILCGVLSAQMFRDTGKVMDPNGKNIPRRPSFHMNQLW